MRVDSIYKITTALILILATLARPVAMADDLEIEVIDLLHRPATDIVPLVSPFVVKGGSITGSDFKLIVKSTPENIEQLKQLLDKLDTALRQLVIYISTDYAAVKAQQETSVSGRVGNSQVEIKAGAPDNKEQTIIIESGQRVQGGASADNSVSARLYRSQSRSQRPAAQKIRVQEGQWAVIRTGKAVPVAERTTNPDGTVTQTITYKNVTSGFKVRPQLSGTQVNLYVRPERASVSKSNSGQININSLETTVQTRLGQWVELGGSVETLQRQQSGISYSTNRQEQQRQRVFVKVELQQ